MSSGLEEFGVVDDETPIVKRRELTGGVPVASAARMSPSDIKDALRKVPLFSGLLSAHLELIGEQAHELEYRKNEYVFHHGDEGDGLYLVVSGAIRISRHMSGVGEEALAVLRDGHHFGEMSLFDDDGTRSAGAICHESARLLKLPKQGLRELMFVDRELSYELLWRFVRGLSACLRSADDRLVMLSATSKF